MTEAKITTQRGFHPFAETFDDEIDFDIDRIGKKIGLTEPQTLLLNYMLCELDMSVWYTADKDLTSNPRLELRIFWDDMVVACCDVEKLMSDVLESNQEWETGQEIEALEKLKIKIELAIAARKVELP